MDPILDSGFSHTRIAIPPKNTLPETNIANENPHLSW